MPALVISIDGPDFAGKSTIANLAVEVLRKSNKEIMFKRTELPSNLTTGFFARVLANSADEVSQNVFALVFAADHLHHYETVIKPLKESKGNFVIIQERSLLSAYIYQSLISKSDIKWIRVINKFTKNMPDLTLVLKIMANEVHKRSRIEKREFDRFETEEHLEEELKAYYNLPEELTKEFNVDYIDSNDNPDEIAERCARRIQKEIDKKFS